MMNERANERAKRRTVHIGIGFHNDVRPEEIMRAIRMFMDDLGICSDEVKGICTADFRMNGALKAVATDLGVPVFAFSRAEMNSVEVRSESEAAMNAFGVKGVAEPCAILGAMRAASGRGEMKFREMKLIVRRKSFDRKITLAVVIAEH